MSIDQAKKLQPRASVPAEVIRGPFDPGGQPSLERDHPLHVSLFAWNVRSGLAATKAVLTDEGRYADQWAWPASRELLRTAERVGFDSQLQYGMWSGYGGATNWNGAGLDFATGAAASAAVTDRLGLFTTVHVGYDFHPLLVAKLTAATDHVSGGRLGVNIVAAYDLADYAQFGFGFGTERDPDADERGITRSSAERYAMADEFCTLLKYLWTSAEPVDFEGKYFQAYGAQVNPRPTSSPRPLLMSAASSDLGIDFAARQCDAIFIAGLQSGGHDSDAVKASYATTAAKVRAAAASHDRQVRICGMCFVVMDETDEKAAATMAWLEQEIDVAAVQNLYSRYRGVPSEALDAQVNENWVRNLGLGISGRQIVGSYETVANELADLYEAGVEHVAMCFWDPARSVEAFGTHVMPLLKERGLRH
ncbi:LLM class flavin-dependent oxidoreductase [Pseudonocardia kongjuensis]|uniref:LLM class flavin-dependent oxidoreductase n=1 Tax=Pseudonocardia kongjuensis TaxID=102227 RepID=A0ABN1Y5S1_9PSEU